MLWIFWLLVRDAVAINTLMELLFVRLASIEAVWKAGSSLLSSTNKNSKAPSTAGESVVRRPPQPEM